jgi:hypothetical protein
VQLQVAAYADGTALVTWRDGQRLRGRTFTTQGTPGARRVVSILSNQSGTQPPAQIAAAGDYAHIVWTSGRGRDEGYPGTVRTRSLHRSLPPGAVQTLQPEGGYDVFSPPTVAVNASGHAAATWARGVLVPPGPPTGVPVEASTVEVRASFLR